MATATPQTGDRVADAYTLRHVGTVTDTGTALDWRGAPADTVRVRWDDGTTGGYAADTVRVVVRDLREGC